MIVLTEALGRHSEARAVWRASKHDRRPPISGLPEIGFENASWLANLLWLSLRDSTRVTVSDSTSEIMLCSIFV
jgi:hypothetical protein